MDGKDYSRDETDMLVRVQKRAKERLGKAAVDSAVSVGQAIAAQLGDAANCPTSPTTCPTSLQSTCQTAMQAVRERLKASMQADREATGVYERHAMKADQLRVAPSGPWGACYASMKAKLRGGLLLGLCGIRGNGKTQMAACLCWDTIDMHRTARYRRACDLLDGIRATYGDGGEGSESEIIHEASNCGLLVIDEWQERRETMFEDRVLTQIIDVRYGKGLDTLVISNLSKAEFLKSLGESVRNRMKECGGVVEAKWGSFRGA